MVYIKIVTNKNTLIYLIYCSGGAALAVTIEGTAAPLCVHPYRRRSLLLSSFLSCRMPR